jgi:hypothetical protein
MAKVSMLLLIMMRNWSWDDSRPHRLAEAPEFDDPSIDHVPQCCLSIEAGVHIRDS